MSGNSNGFGGSVARYLRMGETFESPAAPTAVFRILMKFPEDRTPAGRSRVYLDQFTGAVLLVENTRTAPLGNIGQHEQVQTAEEQQEKRD